ncbi:MAG: glucans biosynthesis glucosyltransferase MdoH [Sandaracinus sp.]|nr:glucans biosynthesis glucosyltransferase MdoH [Sandaracinus sp.]
MIPALDVRGASTSRVRSSRASARRRLRVFLRAIAPLEVEDADALVTRLLAEARAEGLESPDEIVRHAQLRLDTWAERVLGHEARAADPEGLELRRALDRLPHALLAEDDATCEALRVAHAELLADEALEAQPLRRPSRAWMSALLPGLAFGGFATWALLRALATDPVAVVWAGLFGLLCSLHGHALVLALLGWARRVRRPPIEASTGPLPRTAIVMPIYEEDPEQVFARLAAMRERLLVHPEASSFEILVASDTQAPRQAADEARAWRRLAARAAKSGRVPVHYRRRRRNVGKKAGNLAELFVRHANRYRYAIVLDADSLMGAETMIALVRRMETRPQLGLLQAPIALRAGETLFARALQLAHGVTGGLLTSGLAAFSGPDGNYFGHNAVVRVDAFVRCCGLPLLSGAPPLGGPILSHDFVEAALLRRGGFEVRLADDLGDSFEEPPPTLRDYLVRDRRWCQGNLQHLRVFLADGLAPRSRLHLLLGAVAYLLSPLWLLFLLLGAWAGARGALVDLPALRLLALGSLGLLLAPRALGLLHTLATTNGVMPRVRLLGGSVLELVLSALLAPITMVAHTVFVAEIVTGRAVGWSPQRRGADGAWASAVDARTTLATFLGALVVGLSLALAPAAFVWVAPIALPCLFAIPIAAMLGSVSLGEAAGAWLRAPGSEPSPVERALEAHRGYFHADAAARFRDLVLDPSLCARLRDALPEDGPNEDTLVAKAVEVGPAGLRDDERERLLSSRIALEVLHREAWRHWHVEDWELPHGVRAEPEPSNDERRTTLPPVAIHA